MRKRTLPNLSQETIVSRDAQLMRHYRTNVSPPYSETELGQIRSGMFVGIMFLQENGLLTKTFVRVPEDVETMDPIRAEDFTDEGLLFFRTSYQKYLAATGRDFTKDPTKSAKRILERDLKKLRSETL
jgi:hypothetical protein